MIRPPAVAGTFYPDDPGKLCEVVDSFLAPNPQDKKIPAKACLVPHAGYKFSGCIAGEVFRRVKIPQRVVLLGPRHFPRGAPLSILSNGEWQTPLGCAKVDSVLAGKIAGSCSLLREDAIAHNSEHSLEVQLPFLQRLTPSFSFVPIVIGTVRFDDLEILGRAIAEEIRNESEAVLLVISSDMNHYESDEVTRVKDRKAIERVLAIDPRGLYDTVRDENISMCGYAATVAALTAVRELGAMHTELVRYATSGEVNGDLERVVGYAGIMVT